MELIGPLQLRIMLYLWDKGPATIHTVVDHLNAEPGSKRVQYTTALTVMKNLTKRNFCSHRQVVGRQFEFVPSVTHDQYAKQVLGHTCETLFKHDTAAMTAFILKEFP